MANEPWKPVLSGDAKTQARDAVDVIAGDLARRGPSFIDDLAPSRRPSVAGGAPGIALFFAYLAETTGDEEHADRAVEFLDQGVEAVATALSSPSLYTGFPGVGWVSEHLTGRLFEADDEEDGNEDVDRALLTYLEHSPWDRDYDLIQGLVGLGVYALERLHRPTGVACLERVVAQLSDLADERPDGIAWHTGPELLPEHQRRNFPEGYENLGVAHGIPGVLPVLAGAVAAGVAAESSRELLEGAVAFLLANRLDPEEGVHFPYQVADTQTDVGEKRQGSRLAWCYGDPGVAAALACAARRVGRDDWEAEALQVALDAARRPVDEAAVQDAGLCHGAVGLGLLFQRLHQRYGEEPLADAARFWLGWALDFRREDHDGVSGFGDFPYYGPDPEDIDRMTWREDAGFLTGAAGIGLGLLAATTEVEPAWDRLLAVSLPPEPSHRFD